MQEEVDDATLGDALRLVPRAPVISRDLPQSPVLQGRDAQQRQQRQHAPQLPGAARQMSEIAKFGKSPGAAGQTWARAAAGCTSLHASP